MHLLGDRGMFGAIPAICPCTARVRGELHAGWGSACRVGTGGVSGIGRGAQWGRAAAGVAWTERGGGAQLQRIGLDGDRLGPPLSAELPAAAGGPQLVDLLVDGGQPLAIWEDFDAALAGKRLGLAWFRKDGTAYSVATEPSGVGWGSQAVGRRTARGLAVAGVAEVATGLEVLYQEFALDGSSITRIGSFRKRAVFRRATPRAPRSPCLVGVSTPAGKVVLNSWCNDSTTAATSSIRHHRGRRAGPPMVPSCEKSVSSSGPVRAFGSSTGEGLSRSTATELQPCGGAAASVGRDNTLPVFGFVRLASSDQNSSMIRLRSTSMFSKVNSAS